MLKEELGLYSSIFNYSSIGYAIYDKDYKLHKVNDTFAKLVDQHKEDLTNTLFTDYICINDLGDFLKTTDILLGNEGYRNMQCLVRTFDNKLHLKIISNQMKLDEVVFIFSALIDVTAEQVLLNKLEHLSFHDHLTGLYNRRFFAEELNRLDVERNLPLTIVMADVNSLKYINDNFGHAVGDELLCKVGHALKKGFREDDIVARVGGDEFVVLLPNTDSMTAKTIIDRIRARLNVEKILSYQVSVSFGYSSKYNINEDITSVYKKSEDTMYIEKSVMKAGRVATNS